MRYLFKFLFIIVSFFSHSQEICNNGIDDDNDGLIDLNDIIDCNCEINSITPQSIVTNYSFEDTLCCPIYSGMMPCATGWMDVTSGGSADYFNSCGIPYNYVWPPQLPILNNGNAIAGINIQPPSFSEYIGSCFASTLVAGTSYTLTFYTAMGTKNDSLIQLELFGSPTCLDIPWSNGPGSCPLGFGSWQSLDSSSVIYRTTGEWQQVTMTFTPTSNINAFAIGGSCLMPGSNITTSNSYCYFDEFILDSTSNFNGSITKQGTICTNDLVLRAASDEIAGNWQWYLDGVALRGEVKDILICASYGPGIYSAVYTYPAGCHRLNLEIATPDYPKANFAYTTSNCSFSPVDFINQSVYSSTHTYEWDFGDNSNSSLFSPVHQYATNSNFDVSLIITDENNCQDTLIQTINTNENNIGEIEIITSQGVAYQSLSNDTVLVCMGDDISFKSFNFTIPPGESPTFEWDYGDGNRSITQNSNHQYVSKGLFLVRFTVFVNSSCSFNDSMFINVNQLSASVINIVDETCLGANDGAALLQNIKGLKNGNCKVNWYNPLGNLHFSEVINSNDNSIQSNLYTGSWKIETIDELGCSWDSTISIKTGTIIDLLLSFIEPSCDNVLDGSISASSSFTGEYIIQDQVGTVLNSVGTNRANQLKIGVYTINFSTNFGCSIDDTIELEAPPAPSAYFTYSPLIPTISQSEVTFENESINAERWYWNFGDDSYSEEFNPMHKYSDEAKSYTVTLTAKNLNESCLDKFEIILFIEDELMLFVPNSFTPGIGLTNQIFSPVIKSGVDQYNYSLLIYNRWGEIMFKSNNYDIGWDGNYNDRLVRSGIYIWQIEFNETMSGKKHKYNGHVNLLK